jgi:hypothetical protein
MSEIFLNRAKRIQSAKIGEHWLKSRKENREIHESIVAAGLPHATQIEREKYELIGRGTAIHWPLIDEDLSVSGILKGNPSYESEKSLKAWLDERGSIQSR